MCGGHRMNISWLLRSPLLTIQTLVTQTTPAQRERSPCLGMFFFLCLWQGLHCVSRLTCNSVLQPVPRSWDYRLWGLNFTIWVWLPVICKWSWLLPELLVSLVELFCLNIPLQWRSKNFLSWLLCKSLIVLVGILVNDKSWRSKENSWNCFMLRLSKNVSSHGVTLQVNI
jgi:hypothetical protein